MQFPESWLRSFCNPDLSTQQLADLLTMAGLEVEELQPVAPAFTGVVVAQVDTLNKALEGDLAKSRELVVALGDGSLQMRAVASPIRFNDYTPEYGLPPLLNEHAEALLGKDLA